MQAAHRPESQLIKHTPYLTVIGELYGISCDDLRVNSCPPGHNDCLFADDIFICIFVNENICILIKLSLNFAHKGPIDNNTAFDDYMKYLLHN